jgi:hypothetical protein
MGGWLRKSKVLKLLPEPPPLISGSGPPYFVHFQRLRPAKLSLRSWAWT